MLKVEIPKTSAMLDQLWFQLTIHGFQTTSHNKSTKDKKKWWLGGGFNPLSKKSSSNWIIYPRDHNEKIFESNHHLVYNNNICNVKTAWLSTSTSKKSTKTTNLKKMDDFNQSLSDNIFFCTSFVTSPTFWSISTFTISECPLGKMISKDAISSAMVALVRCF